MAASSAVLERKNINMRCEETIQHLIEIFGNVLDLEIIQSVALGCDYDMEATSERLFEMSGNIGAVSKPLPESKKNNQTSYATVTNHKDDGVTIVSEKVTNLPNQQDKNVYSIPAMKVQPYRKSKKEQEFDRIILHVRQGSRVLILLRGLPGSGKSYLAKEIVDRGVSYTDYHSFICSADDFYINRRTGRYQYDPMKISDAHAFCKRKAYDTMARGISPVIIDNTSVQVWEMKDYVIMAVTFGYIIEVVEPFTHWAFNDKELARRCAHGVSRQKIKDMLDRFEKNVTATKLLMAWNLSYKPNCKPPIERSYPPIVHNVMQQSGVTHTTSDCATSPSRRHIARPIQSRGDKNRKTNQNHVEVQDLMDFDNEVINVPNVRTEQHQQNCNPIDSILMHSQMNGANVLKPISNSSQNNNYSNTIVNNTTEPRVKKFRVYPVSIPEATLDRLVMDDSDDLLLDSEAFEINRDIDDSTAGNTMQKPGARNLYPNLKLASWGLPQNAISSWESWDIVSSLNGPIELECPRFVASTSNENIASKCTSDSMTNTSSADFAILTKERPSESDAIKIVATKNRDINMGAAVIPPMSPSRKTMLDKSSMTNEDVLSAALCREREANDEKQMMELVALFPGIPMAYLKDVFEKCKKDLNWTVDLLLDDSKEFLPSVNNEGQESTNNDNENVQEEGLLQANMEVLKIAPAKPEQKNKISPEELLEIKRHIEENVEINKDHYSEAVLRIKNQRHGATSKQHFDQPCTSSSFDAYYTSAGEVISVNSDTDLDNFEPDIDFPELEEEEMMEINLGEGVVSQLETKFGFPEMFPQGFLPIVHVPVSLARQLHALYVESVLVQMENQNQILDSIIKEDEEFAIKLQKQEQAHHKVDDRKTPDLQEIMDEQVASNLYQKETEEWKKLTPNNLAAKLTRQKLYTAFPTVDKTLLVEILQAYNNSYAQTIEVLLASTEQDKIYDPDGTLLEPPITETLINEMETAEQETNKSVSVPDIPKSANEYREEADKHLQKHNELIQKAQQAYQSKQYPVAQFYSDLAKTHTRMYDQVNNLAASAFLQEHSERLQSFSTLDLHYLRVKEAVSALDIFIDTNIQLLQGTKQKCENLYVITGRGKRSQQGKSRLKPAVMGRLKKRDIWYIEVNPGLLKIRVRPHSAITTNIP